MNALATAEAPASTTPDADLIRACAQHPINMDSYNASAEGNSRFGEPDGPLWTAYEATRDFISAAKPVTMAGVLAKARAAVHEATDQDGGQTWGGSKGEQWAADIVNDLLRLAGEGGAA